MLIYNLIKYSDNYSKTTGSLWKYYRGETNDKWTDSESFKAKIKITAHLPLDGNTKDVEIVAIVVSKIFK